MEEKKLTIEEFIEVRSNLEKALSVIEKSRVELYAMGYGQCITKQPLDPVVKGIALKLTEIVDEINNVTTKCRRVEYND